VGQQRNPQKGINRPKPSPFERGPLTGKERKGCVDLGPAERQGKDHQPYLPTIPRPNVRGGDGEKGALYLFRQTRKRGRWGDFRLGARQATLRLGNGKNAQKGEPLDQKAQRKKKSWKRSGYPEGKKSSFKGGPGEKKVQKREKRRRSSE